MSQEEEGSVIVLFFFSIPESVKRRFATLEEFQGVTCVHQNVLTFTISFQTISSICSLCIH